jgi:hypothetical protein
MKLSFKANLPPSATGLNDIVNIDLSLDYTPDEYIALIDQIPNLILLYNKLTKQATQ